MVQKTINIELAANEAVEIKLVRREVASAQQATKPQRPEKRFFPLSWIVEYTGIPKNSIYQMTSKNRLPHIKRGRRLFFDKTKIDQWLEDGSVKTKAEIEADAETFLTNKGRRLRNG